MKKRRPKAIDLFAGAGGFSLGTQLAGIDVIAAVEIDKWCCETLEANKKFFPKMRIIRRDITTLTGRSLLKMVDMRKGELDLLFGGPSCQGFSTANPYRSEKDPRSKMMWQFIRLVGEIQPRFFSIENIRGLLSFKNFFRLLLACLEKHGYIVRFNLLNAAGYGVPQHRIRVIINGVRKDLKIVPEFPKPTHFAPEHLKPPKKEKHTISIPVSLMADRCFAVHGFDKSEVEDVMVEHDSGNYDEPENRRRRR